MADVRWWWNTVSVSSGSLLLYASDPFPLALPSLYSHCCSVGSCWHCPISQHGGVGRLVNDLLRPDVLLYLMPALSCYSVA